MSKVSAGGFATKKICNLLRGQDFLFGVFWEIWENWFESTSLKFLEKRSDKKSAVPKV